MKIVSAGLIMYQNKLLIAQRKRGKSLEYKWEFPGGKLEEGESLEECLHRELMEEFHMDSKVKDFFMESRYEYPDFSISLNAFWVEAPSDKIEYMDSHEQIKWINPLDVDSYDFAAADKPILNALVEYFKQNKR